MKISRQRNSIPIFLYQANIFISIVFLEKISSEASYDVGYHNVKVRKLYI